MENTSLITRLLVAERSKYASLTLINGIPDALSLTTHFTEADLVLEAADHKEVVQDTDQGKLISHTVRARIPRQSEFYLLFAHEMVLVYFETANGEQRLLGTASNPMAYLYERDSGAGNADSRDTQLSYTQTVPL